MKTARPVSLRMEDRTAEVIMSGNSVRSLENHVEE